MIIRYEKSGNRFLDAIYPIYWFISMFIAVGISWGIVGDSGLFDSHPAIGFIGAFIGLVIIFGAFHLVWRGLVRLITGKKNYQGLP